MSGNVGQDIQKGAQTVKSSLKSALGVIKMLLKLFKNLAAAGPPGWIAIVVILVILIIMIILYSFLGAEIAEEYSATDATSGHAQYDAQEMLNNDTLADREKLQKEMNDIRASLDEYLSEEDIAKMEDGLQNLNAKSAKYGNQIISNYDTNAGYQVLSNEVTVLLMLERLTYAYSFTDWEPDYIAIKSVEDKIAELNGEIAKETSANKKLELEEDLEKLKDAQEQLEIKYTKFLELNRKYKEKYKKDFIESDKKSKISPDGKALENKVISYFKTKYGEDTSETMEELSYFHNVIIRTFLYQKSFNNLPDCSEIETWLKNPVYTEDEFVSETDTWQSLSNIEEVYRVNWELMHHEATLKLIMYDSIVNNVLTDNMALSQIKEALASHMPIFQYVTYDEKVIKKTFYDYELYDASKFDSSGKYIYSSNFDTKLSRYTTNDSYDIDFSKVSERSAKEYLLEQYKVQLANQKELTKKDPQLIMEMEQEIAALEDELEDGKNSATLKSEYNANYARVTEDMINQKDDSRMYDPKNHDIVVDDSEQYYIYYAEKELDNYNEAITINETMSKTEPEEAGYKYTYGPWENTSDAPAESECERVINASVSTTMMQSSLKPLAVRTIFNSVDYEYSRIGVRHTDAEARIVRAREGVSWQRRRITREKITLNADGSTTYGDPKEVGYNYLRQVSTSFTNYEAYISSPIPDPDNENILLHNATYVTDFYGQKQIVTSTNSMQTPGTIAEKGEKTYNGGKVDIVKYYQFDYDGLYGNSTIKGGGCGPTCLAMVVDSLTTADSGVVAMCNWAYENGYKCSQGGSYWSLIPEGAKHFGLSVKGISRTDKDSLVKALESNHPVIMICGPGDFTSNGHFIVLTGIDQYGKVSVNDPNSVKKSSSTYTIDKIMANASKKQGSTAVTFWEIY